MKEIVMQCLSYSKTQLSFPLADMLVEHICGAATVARYIRLSRSVADCQFIAANKKALQFYGIERLDDFIGRYLSEFQHPDDQKRSGYIALARIKKHPSAFKAYPVRIFTPHSDEIWVTKKAEHSIDPIFGTIWLTKFEKTTQADIPDLPSLESLGLSDEEVADAFRLMNVRQMEELAQKHFHEQPALGLTSITTSHYGNSQLVVSQEKNEGEMPTRVEKNNTLTCVRCGHVWRPILELRLPKWCARCKEPWNKSATRKRRTRQEKNVR